MTVLDSFLTIKSKLILEKQPCASKFCTPSGIISKFFRLSPLLLFIKLIFSVNNSFLITFTCAKVKNDFKLS